MIKALRALINMTGEQRRSFRAITFAFSGPILTLLIAAVIYMMAWGFTAYESNRINWMGYMGMGLLVLLSILLLAYAFEVSIRSFKVEFGSAKLHAEGDDDDDDPRVKKFELEGEITAKPMPKPREEDIGDAALRD